MAIVPPDPHLEIHLGKLQTLRGPNIWALRPVTRMDLSIGAYDEISSAQIPGFIERLMSALPGLIEHTCSVGQRGGFLTRLRRGTYAAHITEHIAIELQQLAGHRVTFGKTRGTGNGGEYTLVFEHRHTAVGLRAAHIALEVLKEAMDGSLQTVEHRVAELRTLGENVDDGVLAERVRCAITGGGARHAVRDLLIRQGLGGGDDIVDVSPAFILEAGLPFASAEMAVILDAAPRGVPQRFTEPEHARSLVTVVSDVVPAGGVVVAPAWEREVQDRILDGGRRLAVFGVAALPERARRVAFACAWLENGGTRMAVEVGGERVLDEPLDGDGPVEAQLAATLCASCDRSI